MKTLAIRLPFIIAQTCAIFWVSMESYAQPVQISGFSELSLGGWNGSGGLSTEDQLCVYNDSNPDYSITATGNGAPGNAFALSGTGGTIPMDVDFKGASGDFVELQAGNAEDFTGANESVPNCSGLFNATMRVRVAESALASAGSGNFSGSLTILLQTR